MTSLIIQRYIEGCFLWKEPPHLAGVSMCVHGNASLLMSRGKKTITAVHLSEPSEVMLFHLLMATKIIPPCCPP